MTDLNVFVFAVGEPGNVGRGASPAVLHGAVPLCSRHLCDLVAVRADRAGRRGGEARSDRYVEVEVY